MDVILTLQKEKEAFAADLDPKYILPSLSRSGVITANEHEAIKSKTNRQGRFNALFSLLTSGMKNFMQLKFFVEALEEADEEGCLPYPWLAEKLKPALKLDDDVHKILVRGNVPLPVNHLLPREKKIQDIQVKLKEASYSGNPSKWVVLHGPIGSGKSSLASEALRVNYLIKEHFPDGVFWLDFGGNKIKCANELEKNNYDEKIINVLKLLNSNYKFSPDDDLTYLLRNEVVSKKVLLILDEVCDKKVIKRFNIECPILVTTTLKNIMDDVRPCAFIECPNDAQNSDIKLLLSKYVNCDAEQLPDVVQEICKKCGGSLLVTSLIGGSMNYVGNDEETWKYWNGVLDKYGLAGLEKIEEKDVLNVIVNCIKHISNWKEYFFDLVIFKKGTFVPSEVLEIMWNKKGENEPAIFHIAVQLYQRSFVVIKESESGSKFSCCSHDLYVDAVSKFLGKDKIKELHKKFVDKLFELGRLSNGTFDLSKLPKDYIPTFIDYHLYQAEKFDMLEELYLDLKFVEQKICLMANYRSIIGDYECYKNFFHNKEDAENFKGCLKRNGNYILTEEKCDIIQLALFEPRDSIVYKKAKEYANKSKGLYYDWCNKIENIRKFEIHSCSNVKFGAINQDASLIAFIDGFKPEESEHTSWMKVCHLPTANEFVGKNSHSDVINYCAFSHKGDYLVTASADTTVKIFKINVSFPASYNFMMKQLSLKESVPETKLGNLFLTFTEHKYEVVCCSFSSEDRYIISSDIIGHTLVWRFNASDGDSLPIISAELHHVLEIRTEPLRFSSLSNNSKTVGTASYDTIKLWDFETEKEVKKFCCKDRIIRKFIFTDDDSRILIVCDSAILFWDVENDNQQTIFSDKSCKICSCCLSTSGKYIACGLQSGKTIIIIVETKENKVLPGHNDEILNVMFSDDETQLFSISPTRFIIRNVSDIENTTFINGNLSIVMDEEPIIASSSSYSVEIRNGQLVTATILSDEKISSFSLSNDGLEIIIGTEHGSVKVYNINEKSSVELPTKHSDEITYILLSKNNNSFFTCSVDATINVWHKRTHHVTLSGHQRPVVMCAEFKTCNKLLSCCEDGSIGVWNTDSGECIYIKKDHHNGEIACCDISCNDAFLATAFANGSIMIHKTEDGSLQQDFSEPMGCRVRCCQFSPSTDVLIAGLNSGHIMQCHIRGSGTYNICASKHESAVSSIRMINEKNPVDKPLFLSASKSIKLWDRDVNLLQTILFPNSPLGDECTRIWASENFKVLVVVLNGFLYKLRRID